MEVHICTNGLMSFSIFAFWQFYSEKPVSAQRNKPNDNKSQFASRAEIIGNGMEEE